MNVKIYGAKAYWCQVPRIEEGFLGEGHGISKGDDYTFLYSNNPPFDAIDEEHHNAIIDQKGFKIFNVLDIPEHCADFNFDKLGEQLMKADAVTCISDVTRKQIKRYYDLDAYVIWNPIKDVYADSTMWNKEIDILYVGRANDPNKRFSLLEDCGYSVCVIGNERPPFGQYLGPKSDSQLNLYYNMSRFVALPSRFEGLGLPALEAMAAGVIPIVCNDNPNSVLCPDFCICEPTKKAIAERIKKINEDYYRYRNIILDHYTYRIQRKFSKFQIARNIINVYREVCQIQIQYEKDLGS